MADTKVHGGMDENITTALQFTSQMSNYAQTNHNHVQYLKISESGNIYFDNGNNISFGVSISGNSTTITASVDTYNQAAISKYIYFLNSNGHTFGSSVDGGSVYYWVKTV